MELTIKSRMFPKPVLEEKRPVVLLVDANVQKFHSIPDFPMISIPSRETSKSLSTYTTIVAQMLQEGFGRDCTVVGIGGGVVTDLAGFVASTYCRGVPLQLFPTSLLAMVDASIGGKNGINLVQAKNQIGTFYEPEHLYIDPSLLQTQPIESYRDGIVEMIKHGLIMDADYFNWLEENMDKILKKEEEILEIAIRESIRIKLDVVSQDQKEAGLRRVLNFGHTVGHALESLSGYQLSHGTAVAKGMIAEMRLSGLESERLERVLKSAGIPFEEMSWKWEDIQKLMARDKKAKGGKARFVTLERIGKCESYDGEYCREIAVGELGKVLSA